MTVLCYFRSNNDKFYLSEVENNNNYKMITLKLLLGGYQRGYWSSLLSAYDKYLNNWRNILQQKHRQEEGVEL